VASAAELEVVYDELARLVAWGIRMEAAVDSRRGNRQRENPRVASEGRRH
jgi:hypothetical protein